MKKNKSPKCKRCARLEAQQKWLADRCVALTKQIDERKQERDDCAKGIINHVIEILRRDPRFPRLTRLEYELILADVDRDDHGYREWLREQWAAAGQTAVPPRLRTTTRATAKGGQHHEHSVCQRIHRNESA